MAGIDWRVSESVLPCLCPRVSHLHLIVCLASWLVYRQYRPMGLHKLTQSISACCWQEEPLWPSHNDSQAVIDSEC